MKNKDARRSKRKLEKQRRRRARARIPQLKLSVSLGNQSDARTTREGIGLHQGDPRHDVDAENQIEKVVKL